MSDSSKPFSIKNILLQIIPVMLGVFLGLWANNWNESRKSNVQKAKIIQKIEQEILANKNQLEEVLDYHIGLRDSVQVYMKRFTKEQLFRPVYELPEDSNFFWRGTRTGKLRDSGYQTAVISGILTDMEIDLVSLLSQINQTQEDYHKLSAIYTETIINKDSNSKLIDYISFAEYFSYDISITEQNLIKLYDTALEKLKK